MMVKTTKMARRQIWKVRGNRDDFGLLASRAVHDVSLLLSEYEESGLLETDEVSRPVSARGPQMLRPSLMGVFCLQGNPGHQ